jgi:hypothetical protein
LDSLETFVSTYHSFAHKTIINDSRLKSEYLTILDDYKNKKTEFYQELVPKLLLFKKSTFDSKRVYQIWNFLDNIGLIEFTKIKPIRPSWIVL